MNRYRIVGSEAECEPGSNGLVLRNLLSITDPEEMANVEQGLLSRLYEAVLTEAKTALCLQRQTSFQSGQSGGHDVTPNDLSSKPGEPQGRGTLRSAQILRTSSSLISVCLGMALRRLSAG